MSEIVNAVVDMALIKPHPRNYKNHPDEQIAQLGMSHARLSQFRSVVLWSQSDGSYITLAGHGIIEAMKRNKVTHVRADIHPVTLSAASAEAILLADNLHAQNSTDDEQALAHLLQEQQDAGFDLSSLGSDDETLRQMLENLGDSYLGGSGEQEDGEEDTLPDVVETRCKPGDIWQLGRHKIACLDSCDAETVKTLFHDAIPHMVWSDPPYGVSVVDGDGHIGASNVAKVNNYASVIGDNSTATAIASYRLCAEFFPLAVQIWWGANYYSNVLPPSSCWAIWDKRSDSSDNDGMNPNNFADCELAWTNINSPSRIHRQLWCGMIRSGEHEQRIHPTQKPVMLAQWAFEKYGKERDVIYDPFLGSGMSVIAAENLDRTVIGCELSPEYIDLIVARWEKHTGQSAHLLDRVQEVAHG